jgi:hypothetical protein
LIADAVCKRLVDSASLRSKEEIINSSSAEAAISLLVGSLPVVSTALKWSNWGVIKRITGISGITAVARPCRIGDINNRRDIPFGNSSHISAVAFLTSLIGSANGSSS